MVWDMRSGIRKPILAGLVTVFCMGVALPAGYSQEVDEQSMLSNVPDWLTRTDISVFANEDRVNISLETLQPLLSMEQGGIFFQGRATGGTEWDGDNSDNWTLNAGIGARHFFGDNLILGVNAFYDHATEYHHNRVGVGFEVISSNLTARVNGYEALSDWKHVSTVGNITTQERALSGIDGEIEAVVPYMPWLRAAVGGYHWQAKANDDITGLKTSLRGDLTRYAKLEVGGSFDNYDEKAWARLTISLGERKETQFTAADDFISNAPLPKRDLSAQLWQKVLRTNEIVTERRTINASTGTVSGAGVYISGE